MYIITVLALNDHHVAIHAENIISLPNFMSFFLIIFSQQIYIFYNTNRSESNSGNLLKKKKRKKKSGIGSETVWSAHILSLISKEKIVMHRCILTQQWMPSDDKTLWIRWSPKKWFTDAKWWKKFTLTLVRWAKMVPTYLWI